MTAVSISVLYPAKNRHCCRIQVKLDFFSVSNVY